jgi:hypothetical protein
MTGKVEEKGTYCLLVYCFIFVIVLFLSLPCFCLLFLLSCLCLVLPCLLVLYLCEDSRSLSLSLVCLVFSCLVLCFPVLPSFLCRVFVLPALSYVTLSCSCLILSGVLSRLDLDHLYHRQKSASSPVEVRQCESQARVCLILFCLVICLIF